MEPETVIRTVVEPLAADEAVVPEVLETCVAGYPVAKSDHPVEDAVQLVSVAGHATLGEPPGLLPRGRVLQLQVLAHLGHGPLPSVVQDGHRASDALVLLRKLPLPLLELDVRVPEDLDAVLDLLLEEPVVLGREEPSMV